MEIILETWIKSFYFILKVLHLFIYLCVHMPQHVEGICRNPFSSSTVCAQEIYHYVKGLAVNYWIKDFDVEVDEIIKSMLTILLY